MTLKYYRKRIHYRKRKRNALPILLQHKINQLITVLHLKELLDGVLHELSAIVDVTTLRQMYDQAVSKPFGFWFINLMKQPEEMFYSGFEEQFVL